jgi:hypothetical protein
LKRRPQIESLYQKDRGKIQVKSSCRGRDGSQGFGCTLAVKYKQEGLFQWQEKGAIASGKRKRWIELTFVNESMNGYQSFFVKP